MMHGCPTSDLLLRFSNKTMKHNNVTLKNDMDLSISS